jgi:hypothetical protein
MAVRKNVTMSEDTAKWFEDKAEEIGTTQSALMAIALNEYIRNDKALRTMSEMLHEIREKKHLDIRD